VHGKPSEITVSDSFVFEGLPRRLTVGRYHSLFAVPDTLPDCLRVTARTDKGIVMAIEHKTLPIAAVQFHPESIMSFGDGAGHRMMENVVGRL
ncbi:MAG: C26 family cysteine hydrolase domain-containing family, partial [Rhodospirillaceae bacterium]|nr:C26 family cysteine hydrolase domain-containing family [Rhodospirillaceae bacterium]